MTCLPLKQAAKALGVGQSTLRRWIAEGAPVVRRGRRGRGGAALVCPQAVEAWRAAQGPSMDAARRVVAGEFASELPGLMADAVDKAFREVSGPHKRAMAGALAACWYRASCGVLDRLRRDDATIPEISSLPPEIERLRLIASA